MKRQQPLDQDDSDTETKKSCPTKLQEDITKSLNEEGIIFLKKLVYRVIKSQQCLPHEDDFIVETEERRWKQSRIQSFKNSIFEEKPTPQSKIVTKIINKIGTDFDCEKVESIEYSCQEASYRSGSLKGKSNKNSQQQIEEPRSGRKSKRDHEEKPKHLDPYRRDELKEDLLNVLLAGAQDTGKSTFKCCFKKKHRKADEPHIKSRTRQIKYDLSMVDQNLLNRRNNVKFVDLAGFAQNEEDKYLRQIEQYALAQWEHFQARPDEDKRIHLCLYFLRGPRIKDSDINVMKKLSAIFNLIPVIAKSDQYTKEEILEMKEEFHLKVARGGQISLYDLEQFYLLKLGTDRINEALHSEFGRFPPFAVTSSVQRESPESSKFVRKYPWGKVEIENQEHSDFEKLCSLLTSDVRTQLLNKLVALPRKEEPQIVEVVEGVIGDEVHNLIDSGQSFLQKNKNTLIVGSIFVVSFLLLKIKNYLPLADK